MSIETPNSLHAVCKVTASASGAGVSATYLANSGFAASSPHTAVGVYAMTLDADIDAADCYLVCSPNTAGDATALVVDTSDSVKTVTTNLAGAASDAVDFTLVVYRRPGS